MTKYIPARTSLVPDRKWKNPAQAFAEGLNGVEITQTLACLTCIRESAAKVESQIVMVNGTSYCVGHVPDML